MNQPVPNTPQPGILTKEMTIGGKPMMSGAYFKSFFVAIILIIIIIGTALISYGVGYNIAMEDLSSNSTTVINTNTVNPGTMLTTNQTPTVSEPVSFPNTF